MKALHLTSSFLSGAIGVTLIGWGFSFTPFFIKFCCYAIAIAILLILLGFVLDDFLVQVLQVEHSFLYGCLISGTIAFLVGCLVLLGYLL